MADVGLETNAPAKITANALWYKDAVIYQLHVKSFCDGNGDGIGDFDGLISKLDYISSLGANTVWLLPFYPSPRKDDGYDVSAYRDIHPDYGTLSDFRNFVRQAHARGLRIIADLVINHTSDQHPWFKRAVRSKAGSRWRNFYVWSDTDQKYGGYSNHFPRRREVQLGMEHGGRRVLLAPVLRTPAGLEFRRTVSRRRDARCD